MFENRPLTKKEYEKLNRNYQVVIDHYRRTTNNVFTRDEIVILKLLVEAATPAAINNMITRFYRQYPENFKTMHYLHQPITRMFKNKKRSVEK